MPPRPTVPRSLRRFRTLPVVAGAAIVAGGICDKTPTFDPPGIPQVTGVEVIPSEVFAAPGKTFELRARVFSPAGHVVEIGAYPQITIEWSSATAGLFVNAKTNPVTVTLPAATATISDITATVTRRVNGPGGLEESSVVNNPPAVIRMPPGLVNVGAPTDAIAVEHIDGGRPAAVVLDAREGANCVEDLTLAVVANADLGRNLVDGCAPAPEFAVFSSGRSMVFEDQSTFLRWTALADHRSADPLPSPLDRSIGVLIGLDADTGAVQAWVTDEVRRAHAFLDSNRAGILVEPAAVFEHGHQQEIQDLVAACGTLFVNGLLTPQGFDITLDPDLFVLFVPSIAGDIRGHACPEAGDQVGRVIWLSWSEYHPTTIVHELGHMLSLIAPYIETGNGHTNSLLTFRQDNIMWSSQDPSVRARRSHFSLGQIFRMNLSADSWLNKVLDPSAVKSRDCQIQITGGICPALDQDFR